MHSSECCHYFYHSNQNVINLFQKFMLAISGNEEVLSQLEQHFHGFEGSGTIRCMGHHLSVNLPADASLASLGNYMDYVQFLQKVDFQKHNLDDLSDDFFTKFYRAEEINISGNNLTKIPSGFADTKYLTYLNLSKNRLTSLPADIHELADTMEILDISDNPFQDMPNCVFQLTGLTKLYANNIGKVSSLKGICKLTKLTVLCIGYNILESIPAELKVTNYSPK